MHTKPHRMAWQDVPRQNCSRVGDSRLHWICCSQISGARYCFDNCNSGCTVTVPQERSLSLRTWARNFQPGPYWVPAVAGKATSASSTEVRLPDGTLWNLHGDHLCNRVSNAEMQPTSEADCMEHQPQASTRQHLDEADGVVPMVPSSQENYIPLGFTAVPMTLTCQGGGISPRVSTMPQSPALRKSIRD